MSAVWQWFCGLFNAGAQQPLRVGLLNTGELVLVTGCGQVQVLSVATTQTIVDVMYALPNLRLPHSDPPK